MKILMSKRKIIATAAGVAGAVALTGFAAPLPASPGSYPYIYNNFPTVAPATVGTRGVKIAANADMMVTATGLLGGKLGNSAHRANVLTSSRTRHGIQGGATPAAPDSTPGVQFGAGPRRNRRRTRASDGTRTRVNGCAGRCLASQPHPLRGPMMPNHGARQECGNQSDLSEH